MNLIVLIVIIGGTLLLVGLPLIPSIRTLRAGVDSDALVIQDWYDEEEHRMAADVDTKVGDDTFDAVERVDGDFRLDENQRLDSAIAVTGSFEAAAGSRLRAVHAGDAVVLGENVEASGWLHAGTRAFLGAEARVVGSLSAGERLDVVAGGRFERLSAPTIQFGRDAKPVAEEAAYLVQEPTPIPEKVRWIAWSKAIYDDFEVKSRTWLHGDLIVRGDLTVGEAAVIDGTVKVHGSIEVAGSARISGGLFCDGDVRLGPACRIDGVCTAGGDLTIESDTVIGRSDRRVTVTAARLFVADGVRVHGVIAATESGVARDDALETAGEAGTPQPNTDRKGA